MVTKLAVLACTAAAAALTAAAGGAIGSKPPTHFAGFPPTGVEASTPRTGRLVVGLMPTPGTEWDVYADGRIIWQKWTSSGDPTVVPDGARRLDTGYVQQRLTLAGVQLLRSKILSTGLFEQDLRLKTRTAKGAFLHRVRVGGRIVTVSGTASPDPSWNEQFTAATPAQTSALAWIAELVRDPARWLSRSAWADRRIRAFLPACYMLAFDRGYPDLSKLPPPAGKALSRYKRLRRRGDQIVTTRQTRALLNAFVSAGISPSDNHAWNIGFSLGQLPGQPHPSYFHLSPSLPDHCF